MARRSQGAAGGEKDGTRTGGANPSSRRPTLLLAPDRIESKPRLVLLPQWLPLALLVGDR